VDGHDNKSYSRRHDKDGRFEDYLCISSIKAIKTNEWTSTTVSICWNSESLRRCFVPCMEICAPFPIEGATFVTLEVLNKEILIKRIKIVTCII
jgi:hypothetical protein